MRVPRWLLWRVTIFLGPSFGRGSGCHCDTRPGQTPYLDKINDYRPIYPTQLIIYKSIVYTQIHDGAVNIDRRSFGSVCMLLGQFCWPVWASRTNSHFPRLPSPPLSSPPSLSLSLSLCMCVLYWPYFALTE